MLPINVFADDSLHNGLSAPYTWTPTSDYVGHGNLINDLKSMNGYKLSVWFAEHNGFDEKGNPTFDWENPTQIGSTYYWRRTALQTKSGEKVGIDFWSLGNIYSQISQGQTWDGFDGSQIWSDDPGAKFQYSATDWQLRNAQQTNGSWSWKGRQAYFNNLALGLRAINTCGYTLYEVAYGDGDTYTSLNGFNEVRDFFARMIDMENPESVDL